MQTRVKMLKVKIKSLAAEARIIRLEERRAIARKDGWTFVELEYHRKGDVRREQRLSLLAYGFLRGRPYCVVEAKPETPPDWQRVAKLVEKFGVLEHQKIDGKWVMPRAEQAARFEAWKAEAIATTGVAA